MGVVNFGAPTNEVEFLKKETGLSVFVEGGTFKGNTARAMSEIFQKVYTIEKSEPLYEESKEKLKDIANITLLNGDTREHLDDILSKNDQLLFWLDAHWCGGESYGVEDECPLIEELEIIFKHGKTCVILVDDARLFSAPPPKPHKIENWPSLKQIADALPSGWDMIDNDDVFFIFPQVFDGVIKGYFQDKMTRELEAKNRAKAEAKAKAEKKSLLGKLGLG